MIFEHFDDETASCSQFRSIKHDSCRLMSLKRSRRVHSKRFSPFLGITTVFSSSSRISQMRIHVIVNNPQIDRIHSPFVRRPSPNRPQRSRGAVKVRRRRTDVGREAWNPCYASQSNKPKIRTQLDPLSLAGGSHKPSVWNYELRKRHVVWLVLGARALIGYKFIRQQQWKLGTLRVTQSSQ